MLTTKLGYDNNRLHYSKKKGFLFWGLFWGHHPRKSFQNKSNLSDYYFRVSANVHQVLHFHMDGQIYSPFNRGTTCQTGSFGCPTFSTFLHIILHYNATTPQTWPAPIKCSINLITAQNRFPCKPCAEAGIWHNAVH